jgi:peptidoglycan/xylan/chitin deacetylase (PgdA/CDA1 family)
MKTAQYSHTSTRKRIMRIPGIKTGKNFFRWFRAQVYGGALILGYHRIDSSTGALDEVCVSPENFAEHLYELQKQTKPIRLSELVQHLKDGSLPENSVAITFDDGYADNLYIAKPLLEKYEIPATVFICTGFIGKEFWWDELERLVTSSQKDLHTLHLQAGDKQFEWRKTDVRAEAGKRASRHEFYRALYRFLLSLDVEDQNFAMGLIRSWSEVPSSGFSTPRAMSEEEIMRLVDGGLIEIGAHTSHHSMLPQLSFERQKEEIESSKKDLEALVGDRIAGFSYPNGQATVDAKRLVWELGFSYACTSLHDVVRPGSDLYELSRFWQQDVDGETFLKRLNRWMSMKIH